MKILAHRRLLADPARKYKPKGPPWLDKVEQKQKSSGTSHKEAPEGLYADGSPAEIANYLKSSSRDFQHAVSRITFYINRSGKNLDQGDRYRLEQAKDAVYRAYGETPPEK